MVPWEGKSERELMALTVNEIVAALVDAHKQRKDVNLNRLKCLVIHFFFFFLNLDIFI